MHRRATAMVLCFWLILLLAATAAAGHVTATLRRALAAPTSAVLPPPPGCPVTRPNGRTPPGEHPSRGHHGNDALWTALWTAGQVVFAPGGPGSVEPDGSLAMKWPWWWDAGVRAPLSVQGRRLDAPAPPLRAITSDGRRLDLPPPDAPPFIYPESGFVASALLFPSTGCWEVTGTVGEAGLTFVTLVVKVGGGPNGPPPSVP